MLSIVHICIYSPPSLTTAKKSDSLEATMLEGSPREPQELLASLSLPCHLSLEPGTKVKRPSWKSSLGKSRNASSHEYTHLQYVKGNGSAGFSQLM